MCLVPPDCAGASSLNPVDMRVLRCLFSVLVLVGCGPTRPAADPSGPGAVEQLVNVLTVPDIGPGGSTVRWDREVVTYRLALPSYPEWLRDELRAAFAWAAAATGVAVTEVEQEQAEVLVAAGPGAGAHVTVRISEHGSIVGTWIQMGCCRVRPAWEDVLQSFGPLGDHADARSLFSELLERERPGCFDLAVLRTLYSLPPGTGRGIVRSRARDILDDACGQLGGP